MAEQPSVRIEDLQTAADRVVEQFAELGNDACDVATWTADDSATQYVLVRRAACHPVSSYLLQVVSDAIAPDIAKASSFSFNNISHDIEVRGPAAVEFEGLGFPADREAAKRRIFGHLMTANVSIPPEPPKPLEYCMDEPDEFVELMIEEAVSDSTLEALVTLVWRLEQGQLSGEDLWDMTEEMDIRIMKERGLAVSAFNEAYERCRIRLWEEGKLIETETLDRGKPS